MSGGNNGKVLTVSRKLAEILTVSRKSHHPIETLAIVYPLTSTNRDSLKLSMERNIRLS